MYDKFGNFVANPCLHTMPFSFRDKIEDFKRAHPFSKLLWILHPKDSYGKHLERYYNSKYIKKRINPLTNNSSCDII